MEKTVDKTTENWYSMSPRLFLAIVFAAVIAALLVDDAFRSIYPCPEGKCTTIHFPKDRCKIWTEVDVESMKEGFQRLHTEIDVTEHKFEMSQDGMGCVEKVYIFYKPRPPVMDSITERKR